MDVVEGRKGQIIMWNGKEYKAIVIAGQEAKTYAWVILLDGQRKDIMFLHIMDKYMGTAESLIRLWKAFGLEEKDRGPAKSVNEKNGTIINVTQVRLEKIGALKE